MQTFQRGAVAMIRASGARIAVLRDGRLLDYWRQYSQQQYGRIDAEASRQEVFRFVTWLNQRPGIDEEVRAAMHDSVAGVGSIRSRQHLVRAWNGKMLADHRLS